MRRMNGDRQAIEAVLGAHQRRTLHEYARTKALDADAAWDDPSYRTIAIALAVHNAIEATMANHGTTERQALVRAGVEFDLDIETLFRQKRRFRGRS